VKYAVSIGPTETGFSGHSLDVDFCIVAGATYEEVQDELAEGISDLLRLAVLSGYPVPESSSEGEMVEVRDPYVPAPNEDLLRRVAEEAMESWRKGA
jgi:predicted RNase H-like HicB family nuclease